MHPLSSQRSGYADWKAPAEDGRTLIWPEPRDLLSDAVANNRHLRRADAARVQDVPLPELRQQLRAWLGQADPDKPLIATGHQTELYHPGVWAKNALIDAVAEKLGGAAFHFAVDTDEPKHLLLRWPGGSAPLGDDQEKAAWSGLLRPPAPARLERVARELDAAASHWDFRPVAGDFLASLRRQSAESETLPRALTAAAHEVDWGLGLRHHAMLFSPLCQSEPYLTYVCHVLGRAEEFAGHYNAALDDYRRENRIRTPGRPMPNLGVSGDTCEVPFWLDSLADGTRVRASVRRRGEAWALRLPDGSEFAFRREAGAGAIVPELARWARQNRVRLAPRALTLTMLLRLLFADQFVHGIGGGRYDQVADSLIARHFGIEPPRFAVTTATLYFPEAVGRARVCVSCVLQEGHRLRHGVLGDEKDKLVAAIDAAPRRSVERSVLFHEMHRKLDAAANHPAVRQWEHRLEEAEQRDREEKDLFDRELFYALQPRERLEGLIQHYRGRINR
jgi:hypothetical protein